MKLYTQNFGGNLHQTASAINRGYPELVVCVVAMDCPHGASTIVVFRVTDEQYAELTKHYAWEPRQGR